VNTVVLALDISLSACAMVAVPAAWNADWSRVARLTTGDPVEKGASEQLRIGRLHRITTDVLAFAQRHGCTVALAEGYAFGAKFERERIGEVSGAIKLALATRAGLVVERLVPTKTARKLMLGKNPPKGTNPKRVVRRFLLDRGMPAVWREGEVDAFVVANVKLVEIKAAAFATPEPVKERRRKAA